MKEKISLTSATAIVISAMVGTGVYTSLGFQVLGLSSITAVLLLWVVGGVIALFGSMVYGEIGSVIEGSGGEYNYLSRLYHPIIGFMSGFVSATVGFAAPVALSSMAFGKYVSTFIPSIEPKWVASCLLVFVSLIQLRGIKLGAIFQRYSTTTNIILILIFIIVGLVSGPYPAFSISLGVQDMQQILSSSFAVSLVYVSYSYSGWNSSAYIAGEIQDPKKNLPLSLLMGTVMVMFLYVALNFVFLYNVSQSELAGKMEVGHIAALHIFGQLGASIVSALISLGLIASVNAMSFVGGRVTQSIAKDFTCFCFLSKENVKGTPIAAQLMVMTIALIMIYTSTFEHVLTYIGFTLSLFTMLVVAGVFILRRKHHSSVGFKTWGYPITPILFLILDGWMLFYIFKENFWQSLAGLATTGLGALVYLVCSKYKVNKISISKEKV